MTGRRTRWPERFRTPVPRTGQVAVDVALAVVVAAAVTVAVGVAHGPGARPPDALAYSLALAIGVVMLGRRRWPVGILVATVILLFTYYFLGYPGIQPAIPLAAAVYSTAASGRLASSWLIAGWALVSSAFMFTFHLREPFLQVVNDTVDETALLVVVILLAQVSLNRQQRLAEAQERIAQAETDRERETAKRVSDERLHIARDVHDIVAHTISAIAIQAGFVQERLGDDAPDAKRAAGEIRAAAREAMTELKALLGLLRNDQSSIPVPVPGLDQLDQLISVTRSAGLEVTTALSLGPGPLSAAVELTVYRIVQEALTNTVRHAGAERVTVSAHRERGVVTVEVVDDGKGGRNLQLDRFGHVRSGHGLIGMTERAHMLGGTLDAGPTATGGFRVYARLPLPES